MHCFFPLFLEVKKNLIEQQSSQITFVRFQVRELGGIHALDNIKKVWHIKTGNYTVINAAQ